MWLHILIFVAGIVVGSIWVGYAVQRYHRNRHHTFTHSSWPKWQIFLFDLAWPIFVIGPWLLRPLALLKRECRWRWYDWKKWRRYQRHLREARQLTNHGGKKR